MAKVVSDTGSMQLGITGIDIKSELKVAQALQLVSGNLNDLAQPGTMLLFDNQSEKLGAKVGDALTISAPTTRGTNNTIDVRVVAINHSLGLLSTWNAFIPIESLRALYQLNQDSTGVIQILLNQKDIERIPTIAANLRLALDQAGYRLMEPDPRAFWMKFQSVSREDWTGQKLDITSWEDEISFMTWTLKALQGLSAVLIVILIAIIIIGIMNTMWIAIRERTREIGTLRAIGMHRREVLWMFLFEIDHARLRRHHRGRDRRGRHRRRAQRGARPGADRAAVLPDVTAPASLRARIAAGAVGRDHHARHPAVAALYPGR